MRTCTTLAARLGVAPSSRRQSADHQGVSKKRSPHSGKCIGQTVVPLELGGRCTRRGRGEIAATVGLRLRQGRTSQPAISGTDRLDRPLDARTVPRHQRAVDQVDAPARGGREIERRELADLAGAEGVRLVRQQDHLRRRRDDLGDLNDRIAPVLAIGEDVLASAQREQVVRVGIPTHAHPRRLPDRAEDGHAALRTGRFRRGDRRLDRIHEPRDRPGASAERRQLAQQRHAIPDAARIGHPDRHARGLQALDVAAAVLFLIGDHQIGPEREDAGDRGALGAAKLGELRHHLRRVYAPSLTPTRWLARPSHANASVRLGTSDTTRGGSDSGFMDRTRWRGRPRRAAPRPPAGRPRKPAARSAAARRARAPAARRRAR